ncbi:hypothetical protein I6E61_13855 [Psychrobacter sp. NZS113]|uniref:hypothetical protein n=1 Tax=Psychrobacter sp. NZS113 TaxID=2792045 RepID=UPI0018CF4945|nr:hypothetical protein [Psychrobacter sp. NZS113]MBH0097472.1 hypothetical protein [Psychrobacter sp. NZS113]
MENKIIFLSTVFFITMGLTGCQTIKESQKSSLSNSAVKTNWAKNHEVFKVMPDDSLQEMESRIVFFRNANSNPLGNINPRNINIGMGPNSAFQVSLTNGHYSDLRVCNGLQLINVKVLDEKTGKITNYSKQYQLSPQTTTYLQVASSKEGSPIIQQVPADEALLLMKESTRQNHQISRVPSDCNHSNKNLKKQPI